MDDTVYIVTAHRAARNGVMKVESVIYTANGETVDGITFYSTTVPDKPTPPTPPDETDSEEPVTPTDPDPMTRARISPMRTFLTRMCL